MPTRTSPILFFLFFACAWIVSAVVVVVEVVNLNARFARQTAAIERDMPEDGKTENPRARFTSALHYWRVRSSVWEDDPLLIKGQAIRMFNNSYNSLSRSQTPNSFNTANRPSPSPKCFGKNTHVLKEEYEREKVRWQAKLDEAEQKLNEAAINNSELFQIKAELNRKIIDFEKNQRPLIEQNRRLNERIRVLTGESKTLEQKLCYSQDDFLSLRDAFDRLTKENSTLKEQRAFPEKLEELSRYRSQVLDYSKCITACRQSILEKDRRYDLLVQKFKKYRKCLLSKRNGIDSEDDRQSCVGSEEGSLDSSSLTGLDTIAEDLDEDNSIEFVDLENSNKMTTALERAQKLKEDKEQLELLKTKLEKDLANSQEHNDLLEFQLVELTEGSQRRNIEFFDKQCATEIELVVEDIDQSELEIKTRASVAPDFISQTRGMLHSMLCKSALFGRKDREGLRCGIEVIDSLQNVSANIILSRATYLCRKISHIKMI
uniref:Uncharacterized protein n=1 Tax=Ditylenchus dipsaci TaxID=166011 RepID=A0A915DIB9_9BILA